MSRWIDLAVGGPAWVGWRFGVWGRARDWRLTAPCGTHFQAGEILEIPAIQLDLDYLRGKVRALEARQLQGAVYLTPDDAAVLRAAAGVLERIGSPYRTRRDSATMAPPRLAAVNNKTQGRPR